jgi:putative endonuclease
MGWGKYTSKGIPWELKYYESYETKTEALRREREIKSKKSRKYIEALVSAK